MADHRKAYLSYPDENLITLINRDDRHAYAVLLQRYSHKVIRLAFSVLRNEEEAQDVAQDVFMSLLISLQKWDYERQAKFSTWIHRVTFNKALDYKRKRRPTQTTDNLEIASTEKDAYSRILEQQISEKIQTLLKNLPDSQRQAIFLYYYKDMDIPAIADNMNSTQQAVRSLIKRAKAILRDKAQHSDHIATVELIQG